MDSTNSQTVVVSDDAVILTREQAVHVRAVLEEQVRHRLAAEERRLSRGVLGAIREQVSA